jgi:hypothetical protein
MGTITFYFARIMNPTPVDWVEKVNQNCGLKLADFDPILENIEKFVMALLLALAVYLGVIIDQKWFLMHQYPFYSETPFMTSLYRTVLCVIISCPVFLPKLFPK